MANKIRIKIFGRWTGELKRDVVLDDVKRIFVRGETDYDEGTAGNICYDVQYTDDPECIYDPEFDDDHEVRHWEFDDLEIIIDPDSVHPDVGTDAYLL